MMNIPIVKIMAIDPRQEKNINSLRNNNFKTINRQYDQKAQSKIAQDNNLMLSSPIAS